MAASMLYRRTTTFCGTFTGISLFKTNIPANTKYGLLVQIANYNPKPLKLNLREPYVPDKENEKTPDWQKTFKYDRKLYGRYGSASGIDPATLWPSDKQLEEIIKDENEWHPPLEVMLKNIAERERQETAKRREKEKLIAANMAKMPKMISDWRREKREAKQKMKEDKARRAKLLAEAQERFGYAVDPRTPKFLEMVAEIEKEEKKKKKLMKRRLREEQATTNAASGAAPPTASS